MCIKSALVIAAITGFAACSANAALTVDLRLTDGLKSKTVTTGETVTLNVFAVLPVGGATAEQFQSVNASFLSAGGLLGNFTSALAVGPFDGTNHQDTNNAAGVTLISPIDLDLDGDLDIGSNADAQAANYFIARANALQTGNEFQIGTLAFQVTGLAGSTTLNFRQRNATPGALYFEDGVVRTGTTNGGPIAGTPVTLSVVPEPTSLALVGLAAGGLLGRRRRA